MVEVMGAGYAASDMVSLSFGLTNNMKTGLTNNAGMFTISFTVDVQIYGATTIIVTGANDATSSSSFFITPSVYRVTPSKGTVGTMVELNGNGYGATDTVRISFGETATIKVAVADSRGCFATTWTVDTQVYGSTVITAVGKGMAQNSFTILPSIYSVTPSRGTVGTIVRASGAGYAKGESITISLGNNSNIKTASSTNNGLFTALWTVDTQAYGLTLVSAVGVTAGSATNSFFICPQVYVVSPTKGTIGTTVTIRGTGYAGYDSVTIAFGNNSSIKVDNSLVNGYLETSFVVDTQGVGIKTITAIGALSESATNTFTIIPSLYSVVPTTGTVGTTVEVRGAGYGPTELITIGFGNTANIGQVFSDNRGYFATNFVVNLQNYGTTTVHAQGNISGTAANTFFIKPNIYSVEPTEGSVGTIVAIIGSGYEANDAVIIAFGATPVIGQAAADNNGYLSTTFTVDTQAFGTMVIRATGTLSESAQNSFKIKPKVYSVLPTEGTVGTVVSIRGNGYAVIDVITVAFGTNSNIKKINANSYGILETTFTIDTQVYGVTSIIATGTSSDRKSVV
jgi:hypothetical protein